MSSLLPPTTDTHIEKNEIRKEYTWCYLFVGEFIAEERTDVYAKKGQGIDFGAAV